MILSSVDFLFYTNLNLEAPSKVESSFFVYLVFAFASLLSSTTNGTSFFTLTFWCGAGWGCPTSFPGLWRNFRSTHWINSVSSDSKSLPKVNLGLWFLRHQQVCFESPWDSRESFSSPFRSTPLSISFSVGLKSMSLNGRVNF